MKTKLITIVSTVAFAAVSNGAIALSGTALNNVQGTTPGTDLVAGRLGLLLIDTAGDGFLNGYTATIAGDSDPLTGLNALTPKTDFAVTGANLAVASTFLGDYIAARLITTVFSGNASMSGALTNFDNNATYAGKNYAIVWFDTLTNAGVETLASGYFGIARGADWILPAGNTGTQSFGTGAANLDQILLTNVANGSATAAAGQGVAFATAGTTLQFIPEPSAALLGVLGALGLLRRRRI